MRLVHSLDLEHIFQQHEDQAGKEASLSARVRELEEVKDPTCQALEVRYAPEDLSDLPRRDVLVETRPGQHIRLRASI